MAMYHANGFVLVLFAMVLFGTGSSNNNTSVSSCAGTEFDTCIPQGAGGSMMLQVAERRTRRLIETTADHPLLKQAEEAKVKGHRPEDAGKVSKAEEQLARAVPIWNHLPKLPLLVSHKVTSGCIWTAIIWSILSSIVFWICRMVGRDAPNNPNDEELVTTRPVPEEVYARFSPRKRCWLLLTDMDSGPRAESLGNFVEFTIFISLAMMIPFSVHDFMEAVPGLYELLMWWVLIVFSMESIARFVTCPDLGTELTRRLTVIDLLALVPCYAELVFQLTNQQLIVKALRCIRLVRILKFLEHSKSPQVRVFLKALSTSGPVIALSFALLCTTVLIFALLMVAVEQGEWVEKSDCNRRRFADGHLEEKCSPFGDIPHACYWAMTTVTTVGYGDVYPITTLGKIVASFAMYTGILSLALPVGMLANHFQNVYDELGQSVAPSSFREDSK